MSKCDKLLKKAQNSPNNLHFEDICYLAECYGFEFKGQRGSHRQYKRPGHNELMNYQSIHGKAKPNEVKQLLNAIEELAKPDEGGEN
jgi:predicted RNA binding protein YcfA (HicA-like mRNA interferase family)